jgi:hypothetical protein
MKKSLLALAVLGAFAGTASAQSSVTIYGIVDAAVRFQTNMGTGSGSGDGLWTLAPGGMSQSRLGFNINEDLGGGLRAIANMEHRFNSDNGMVADTDFWRQSWVGLQSSSFGRITIGRQYNVLFDAYTGTYPSFKYSPYIEAFKPEIGPRSVPAMTMRSSTPSRWAGSLVNFSTRSVKAMQPSPARAASRMAVWPSTRSARSRLLVPTKSLRIPRRTL